VNISHANAPVVFNWTIGDPRTSYADIPIVINLSNFYGHALFIDPDAFDVHYNQSVNNYTLRVYSNATNSTVNSSISYSWSNSTWILTLSSVGNKVVSEVINISMNDSEYVAVSNSFTVDFTTPPPPTTIVESGGGGGSVVKPVSLHILVPGPLSSRKKDKLIVPVMVENTGKVAFSGIILRNVIAKDGVIRSDMLASFDRSTIDYLPPGKKENLTLIVDVNAQETGLYEITLNATAASPVYSDTAKIFVNVEEGATLEQRILFTEELIAQNPQCIEIKEVVDEAKALLAQGYASAAGQKIDEAVESCQEAVAQTVQAKTRQSTYDAAVSAAGIVAIAAFALGIAYYLYKRIRMRHVFAVEEQEV
jgi:hypothetical protein